MDNPFIFGAVVKGENFCDREQESKDILGLCKSHNSLILISPRRYGKTSLVVNTLEKNKIPYILVDCTQLDSKEDFVRRIAQKYLETLKEGNVIEKIKYLSKVLNIEFNIKAEGFEIKVKKFEYGGFEQLLKEITKQYTIVFDEFQDVFELDKTLVQRLRGILQFIPRTHIFLGSKKHMILHIFENQNSAFYKFGHMLHLEKIPKTVWKTFIINHCKKTKVDMPEQEIEIIIDYANNIPFYVQYLAYHVWEGKKTNKSAEQVIKDQLQSNYYIYEGIFSKLPRSQRNALKIVANRKENLFAQDLLEGYQIKNAQLLNKSLNALIDKGALEKNGTYFFVDPLFERFVLNLDKK